MNWRRCGFLIVLSFMPLTTTSAWSSVGSDSSSTNAATNVSPYIDLVICPVRDEPWSCARQQSARILDIWDVELNRQWTNLKVEADRQLNSTLEKRGYSASVLPIKEKPSTLLTKIEIGTNFMKKYLAETMDGFLGREYEYLQGNGKSEPDDDEDENEEDTNDDNNNADDTENDNNGGETDGDSNDDNNTNAIDEDEEEQNDEADTTEDDSSKDNNKNNNNNNVEENENAAAFAATSENASNGVEFIEIGGEGGGDNNNNHDNGNDDGDDSQDGQLKRPDGKKKNKKKKGQAAPANLIVVQQPAVESSGGHGGGDGGGHGGGGHGGGKPLKEKRKKRKKHGGHGGGHGGHGGDDVLVLEEEPISNHHFGLGLLEELVDGGDFLDVEGGKRKKKHPSKYGRSNGVTRGKKKKKKKLVTKLLLLGSVLKAKIELLLKILGAHLQIKFFAIALIGLLINIARFWIDVKRGGTPQKVVYVEHAHHQHHYEDHGGEEWSEPSGSYWKRSLQTEQSTAEEDSHTDSYQLKSSAGGSHYQHHQQQQQQQQQQPQDAHYMAYRGQWQ